MDFLNKQNLIKAGIVTAAAMLTLKMLGGKSKLIQGGATLVAVAVALPLADKVG